MMNTDNLRTRFPQWLIWHPGHEAGTWGAMHRDTGLILAADAPQGLTEAMTSLNGILAGQAENEQPWNGATLPLGA
jgi:hypothetical protein